VHFQAIDSCIQYLLNTKKLSLVYGGAISHSHPISAYSAIPRPPEFMAASDASYADDSATRRSSEGWIFTLFGGPIDWKAIRQRTVTKSSTEAELLSLSHAASELIWWQRLFNSIGLHLDQTPTLLCDNQQTLRIVRNPSTSFKTSLRHVDIHNHWLRQEHKEGNLDFDWIPTANMPADGLTKLLPSQKHASFIKLLNMVEPAQ